MRRPGLSLTLAALMALAWAAVTVSGTLEAVIVQASLIPARLAGEEFAGAFYVPAWLTPITSTFVHGGLLHLAFNALILVYCGPRVEAAIGGRWLAVLLVAGAYGAALAELAWAPGSRTAVIGASGAIAALIAMYAMLFSEQRVAARGPVPGYVLRALWLMAAWVAIQLLIAVASAGGVAVLAHIGGFAAGLILSRPILNRRFARQR